MCGSILYLLKKIKIRKVIIGKQFENSINYQEFIEIVKKQKIEVEVVEAGHRINIEKNLYFDILWPSTKNVIIENNINNNSLVCKMVYNNTSVLFTGDIEQIAENKLVELYKNTNKLKSTILKVAHHGSKTSSTEQFLALVKPKITIIGVGKNNKFGHPNSKVIERIKKLKAEVYRTDENGEITIIISKKGMVNVKPFL